MFDAPDVEMGMGEPGQPDAAAFTAVKSEPGADSMDGVQAIARGIRLGPRLADS